MGRAYTKELASLASTHEWASKISIDPLQQFVADAIERPLIAIASGGSTTAAHLAALLHRARTRTFAHFSTPLEVLHNEPALHTSAALLLSASGKNKDVLAALERCVHTEVRALATLCMQSDSPLSNQARTFERGHVFETDAPFGKDGFLATNSLLATCVLIARAYGVMLPPSIDPEVPELASKHVRSFAQVLYGGWGAPVATDLESRLNESAIAAAQVSDYRNLGHGRHLWLARRAADTIVIAIVTPETKTLAQKTCALLPREVPVIELRTDRDGAAGTLELIVQSIRLVGALGELQSIDPGRPSVPDFGRKLYHLSPSVPADDEIAPVTRKLLRCLSSGVEARKKISSAFDAFIARLNSTKLGGIVLDYDGTLCTRAERFGDLRSELAKECTRLLDAGIVLGIATGRGRSVRETLQKALPERIWKRVLVGYYNGGELGALSDCDAPNREAVSIAPLDAVVKLLRSDGILADLAELTVRRRQITVEPKTRISTDALLAHVMTVVGPAETLGIRVLASSHSVDVLPPGVGKLAVVEEIEKQVDKSTSILCIGDRGMWPGNDSSLLAHEPALSVDDVSGSLLTCWNIAPRGISGPDATVRYLRALTAKNGVGLMKADGLWSNG